MPKPWARWQLSLGRRTRVAGSCMPSANTLMPSAWHNAMVDRRLAASAWTVSSEVTPKRSIVSACSGGRLRRCSDGIAMPWSGSPAALIRPDCARIGLKASGRRRPCIGRSQRSHAATDTVRWQRRSSSGWTCSARSSRSRLRTNPVAADPGRDTLLDLPGEDALAEPGSSAARSSLAPALSTRLTEIVLASTLAHSGAGGCR